MTGPANSIAYSNLAIHSISGLAVAYDLRLWKLPSGSAQKKYFGEQCLPFVTGNLSPGWYGLLSSVSITDSSNARLHVLRDH